MFPIIEKQKLSAEVFRMVISAPYIAKARKPGQFIIIQQGGDFAERIPLTIADADPSKEPSPSFSRQSERQPISWLH